MVSKIENSEEIELALLNRDKIKSKEIFYKIENIEDILLKMKDLFRITAGVGSPFRSLFENFLDCDEGDPKHDLIYIINQLKERLSLVFSDLEDITNEINEIILIAENLLEIIKLDEAEESKELQNIKNIKVIISVINIEKGEIEQLYKKLKVLNLLIRNLKLLKAKLITLNSSLDLAKSYCIRAKADATLSDPNSKINIWAKKVEAGGGRPAKETGRMYARRAGAGARQTFRNMDPIVYWNILKIRLALKYIKESGLYSYNIKKKTKKIARLKALTQ